MICKQGFTLIEILVAVAIVVGLTTTVGVAVYKTPILQGERLLTACRRISTNLAMLQGQAVMNGREYVLIYDLENRRYSLNESVPGDEGEELQMVYLPRNVRFRGIAIDEYGIESSGEVRIHIRRDGWIRPHLVYLENYTENYDEDIDEKIYTVEVMPLTGYVEIHPEEIDWRELML